MMHDVSEKNRFQGKTLLVTALLFFGAASFFSCVLAIPVIIHHMGSKIETATVQVPATADSVYQAALKLIQKNDGLEIIKQEDDDRSIEIKKAKKFASIKATEIDSGKSQLTVSADADTEEKKGDEDKDKDKEEDKELALKIITAICNELGVKYTVSK
jgi:hypothetical protein